MAYTITPAPGTISIANGAAAVVGVGTLLTLYGKGALLNVPGFGAAQLADAPTDDLAATLVADWGWGDVTDAAFEVWPMADAQVYSARVRALIEKLGDIAATGLQPDAIGDLADRDDFDGQAKGYIYLSLDGDGDTVTTPVFFIKASGTSGDWSTAILLTGPRGPSGLIGNFRGAWVTGRYYAVNDASSQGGSSYIVPTGMAHTSGVFATDLAAGKWVLVNAKGDAGAPGANAVLNGIELVETANYTILAADKGKTIIANKATAIALTLDTAANLGAAFMVPIKNIGAGSATISIASAGAFDDGTTSIVLKTGQSLVIECNGTVHRAMLNGGGSSLPPKITYVTASATFHFDANTKSALVQVQAAGGGGSGANSASSGFGEGGPGGGGGGYSEKLIDVVGGSITSATIVVGAGGAAGSRDGGTGGTSSYADGVSTLTALGGAGGVVGSGLADNIRTEIGGIGGAASGGALNIAGYAGGSAFRAGASVSGGAGTGYAQAGMGANSRFGSGGASYFYAGAGNYASAGRPASGYGSGGAGACSINTGGSVAGAAGASGIVVITEYR